MSSGTFRIVSVKKESRTVPFVVPHLVLAKYKMPIKRGMVVESAERIRALNDDAFVFPVSLLGA